MKAKLNKSVAIIILNWNGYELTKNCIKSIKKNVKSDYDLIIIDNASTDNSYKRLSEEFKDLVLIKNEKNEGYATGNNIGIQYALDKEYENVLILNNDVLVDSDFLLPLMSVLNSDNSIGAVTPKILFNHDRNLIWALGGEANFWIGKFKSKFQNKIDNGQYDFSFQPDYLTGCCFLVKHEVLKQVGFFDDKFFAYCEDLDLSLRIKQHGYKIIYTHESKIYHIAGASTRRQKPGSSNPVLYYLNFRNRIWIFRKYGKLIQLPSFYIIILFRAICYSIVFIALGRLSKLKNIWLGIFEGICK